MADNKQNRQNRQFTFRFDRLSTTEIGAFAIGVLLLVGTVFYIWRLEAQVSELAYEKKVAEQRQKALQDSLRKVGSYKTDSTGTLRNLYAKLNLPTTRPDTLGGGRVQGDVEQKTETTVDPKAQGSENTINADTSASGDFLKYELDEEIGRYRLQGDARVSLNTGELGYDLTIDGAPIELSIYQARREGQMQTVIDAPSTVQVQNLQGYSKPTKPDRFDRWVIEAPVITLRPDIQGGIGVGAAVGRRFELPLGAVGFVETAVFSSPSPSPDVTGAARAGIQWTF